MVGIPHPRSPPSVGHPHDLFWAIEPVFARPPMMTQDGESTPQLSLKHQTDGMGGKAQGRSPKVPTITKKRAWWLWDGRRRVLLSLLMDPILLGNRMAQTHC
uniref:Uncharacterized protein n=1 Tax=Eutreptiella gymnastica TaxID=73025 RepID=A0A7S1N399_9EUGL